MALSARTKSLDRVQKILAVEIVATHKTDRTAGVLDTASLCVTDARFLVDETGGNIYHSRLLPGYVRTRSTGAKSGTGALLGTGIGAGTEPNKLSFSVFAGNDGAGNNLRGWQEYQLKGAIIIARLGAVCDEFGAAIDFDDFEEVFYGRLQDVPRISDDVWQFGAVSPEGYKADSALVRRSYRGLDYGIQLDNSATSPIGTADAWLSGTASAAFTPTAGAYSWGAIIGVPNLPSATGVNGELFRLSVGGVTRLEALFVTASDRLNVLHHDGAASTAISFTGWDLVDVPSEAPFRIGGRYDGSALAYLYVDAVQIEAVAMTRDVGTGAVDVSIGRQTSTARPLDVIVYELWIDETDVGDEELRKRMSGPLRGDVSTQGGLWCWWPMFEGGALYPGATAADQRFNCDLTIGGTAAWITPREGDHPDVSPRPQGESMPAILSGRVFNFPATPLEISRAIFDVARDAATVNFARLDGAPAQVAYSRTGTWSLTQSPVDGIEDQTLAGLVIARDEATGQQGSEVEVYGDAGSPSCDGTYEVISVSQGRYVGLGTPIGGALTAMTGMPREDRTATCEVTMPTYVTTAGITLDAAAAVDKGGGLVGLPSTAHGLDPRTARVKIAGTGNYDATYTLDESTTVDELVVTATYAGETFGGSETVGVSEGQVTDLGDGRVQMDALPTARLTADMTATQSSALREVYTFLRNARDRSAAEVIEDASRVLDEVFVITWAGDNGERDQVFSMAIPGGADATYRDWLTRLLRSYFAWSSDAGRTLVESTYFPQVRMGHFGAPAAGGTAWDGRLVTSEQVAELSTEPPAWRLTATYRRNYSPIPSTPTGVPAAVREQLAAPHSRIEIARDESIQADFEDARDLVWETEFFSPEVAALAGQRVWGFVSSVRLWRRWEMALLPDEIETGEQFSLIGGSHDELAPTDGTDTHFFATSIEDAITRRGVRVIAIS